jgi:DNA-binding NarL/FixJ family response regulator
MRSYILLIADAYPARSKKLAQYFSENSRFSVLPPVGSGTRALKCASLSRADAVLADLSLPGLDGLQLIKELNSLPFPPGVFIHSSIDISPVRELALKLGALMVFKEGSPFEAISSGILGALDLRGGESMD